MVGLDSGLIPSLNTKAGSLVIMTQTFLPVPVFSPAAERPWPPVGIFDVDTDRPYILPP
jgi:hypothetical protein